MNGNEWWNKINNELADANKKAAESLYNNNEQGFEEASKEYDGKIKEMGDWLHEFHNKPLDQERNED